MQLDPNKCPIGTVGWLQLISCADLMDGDFDWVKEPSVVLGDDRKWHSTNPSPVDNTFPGEATQPPIVFADWQSAVRDVVERERKEARELLDEANKLMDEATAVERLLRAELVPS